MPRHSIPSLFSRYDLACSRRSDSGARGKNRASERAGKKRPLPQSPPFFPALSLSFFFARAPLSEQARYDPPIKLNIVKMTPS